MSAAGLLQELRDRGVELRAEGDRLLYRPTAAVSGDLFKRLKATKAELLFELEQEGATTIWGLPVVLYRDRVGVEVVEIRRKDPTGSPRFEKRLQHGVVGLVSDVTEDPELAELWVAGLRSRDECREREEEK